MKNATQNAAATRNTTAKAVIKQTTNGKVSSPNAANANRKAVKRKAEIAKVNAAAIAKKPSAQVQNVPVEIPSELLARAAKAATRYKAIITTQTKQLVELKDIGSVIFELRSLYASDKQFGKEVKATPFAFLSRQDRYDLMKLYEFWDGIQTAITEGKMAASTSATMLVRNYSALLKSEGNDAKVGRNVAKGKTKAAKAAKKTASKAKSTDETSTVKFTEQSVAQDLYALINKHNLDADLIFDKLHDIMDAAKAAKH